MPIYEYRCEACGHEMDALQKMTDPPLTDCPECGAAALKKKISAAAFRLKGSGWYETDFKKDGRKNVIESGDKSSDKPSDKSSDAGTTGDQSKGDGKTPAKTDTKAKTPATKDTSKPAAASSATATGDRKVAA